MSDEGFLSRYTARDHQNRTSARAAHYDLLREHGFSERRAREESAKAADQQMASLDRFHAGATGLRGSQVAPSQTRSRFRVRYPWEPEDAGISLDKPKE